MSGVGIVGNVSRDRIAGETRVGGGAYYGGRALRALVRRGVIATKCADADRRDLLTPLACLGLPVLWREAPSTAAFELAYEGEERRMTVEAAGPVWSEEDAAGWVRKALGNVAWVQVAALARSDFPAGTLAELARGRRLLLDGQGLVRPGRVGPLEPDAEFDPEVLRHVAALKLAESEALLLIGELEMGPIRSLGVPEVLVTLGSRGALVFSDGLLEHVSARVVEPIVDPTGAGDAFAAAYIAGRAAGHRPVGAARRAASLVADLLAGGVR